MILKCDDVSLVVSSKGVMFLLKILAEDEDSMTYIYLLRAFKDWNKKIFPSWNES